MVVAQGLTEVAVRYWLMLGLLPRVYIHCGLSMQPGLPDNVVIEYQRQQREEGGREREGKREAKYVLPFYN